MERKLWTMASGVAAALSFSAAVLLMMSVEFQRADKIEKGPMSVKIDWFNLGCKIPSPNLGVPDAALCQYWQLPENVRLSSRMARIGRCAIAVSNRNQRSKTKIDGSVCYGACFWWVPSVAIVALVIAVISFCYFVSGFLNWKRKCFTNDEWDSKRRWEMIRAVAFAGTFLIYTLETTNEFTYTKYGDIYPTNYFDIKPITWIVGWWLYLGALCTQSFAFCAVTAMVTKPAAAARESSSKRAESTGQDTKKSDDGDSKTSNKDFLYRWYAAHPTPIREMMYKASLETPSPSPPRMRPFPHSLSPPPSARMSDRVSITDMRPDFGAISDSDTDSIVSPWSMYKKEKSEEKPSKVRDFNAKKSGASAEKKDSDVQEVENQPKHEGKNEKRHDKTEMLSRDSKNDSACGGKRETESQFEVKKVCQDKNDKVPAPEVKKEVTEEKRNEPEKEMKKDA